MVPTSANGQPAFALYMKQPDGSHQAFQIQVLTLTDKGVSHVSTFFDTTLFAQFGLPEMGLRIDLWLLAHRALNPPSSSSLAEEKSTSAPSSSPRRRAIPTLAAGYCRADVKRMTLSR